jgi:hypothetical protein
MIVTGLPPDVRKTSFWKRRPAQLIALLIIVGVLAPLAFLGVQLVASTTPNGVNQFSSPTSAPAQVETATQTADENRAGYAPKSSSYFYADATSHSVNGFGDVFARFGGVASLGYPVTELFIEQSHAGGQWNWVQYFEKAEVEYHQDGGTNAFQLTQLGVWRFNQKYAGGAPSAKTVPGSGSQTFTETKHTVSGLFLAYWKSNGDLARFGYPISEPIEEKSDATGKTYVVQYFERVEMEYHPEFKTGSHVQLAALGTLKLKQVYAGGTPNGASKAVPSPTVNAQATAQAQSNATATVQAASANATATANEASLNATATAQAEQVSANATATAQTFASYQTQAPSGRYEQSGIVAIACGYLHYEQSVGYESANENSKFLVMGISVTNHTGSTLYVNPNDFTIVGTDGYSVGYNASTFYLDTPFPAVELQPETYASGSLSFLVRSDFIPAKLVWSSYSQSQVTVTIVTVP